MSIALLRQAVRTYREAVNADEREEIAASVAAHAELGPRYEAAVAEGLVERIGEEIDKRIDARLRGTGHQEVPWQAYLSPGHQTVPPGYNGQRATSPAAPGAAAGPPATLPAATPQQPRRGGGVSGVFLGLGSMGLGVGATAVVVSHHIASGAAVIMVLLIWFTIGVINLAHSQRR